MAAIPLTLSTTSPGELRKPGAGVPRPSGDGILAQQWPTLARALDGYTEATAEEFTRMAYERVDAGLIRRSDRVLLAEVAEELAIRPFDAQLLIACAIRRWALDHPRAAGVVVEKPSGRAGWTERAFALFAVAVVMDVLILWKWLG